MKQAKFKILKYLENKIPEYKKLILLDFNNCPTNLLKKSKRNIKKDLPGSIFKQIKTSLICKSIDTEVKFGYYLLLTNNKQEQVLEMFENIYQTDIYKPGDISEVKITIPKGVTKYRPSLFFRILEKIAPVRLERGFISFIQDYILLEPNQEVTEIVYQILKEFNLKPKKKRLKIKHIITKDLKILDLSPIYQVQKSISILFKYISELYKNNIILEQNLIQNRILEILKLQELEIPKSNKEIKETKKESQDFDEDIFI
jgi:ribosomal protein L10